MKSYTISLLLSLLFVAINLPAQDFKVIEETKDYILKVADSGYYYAHGLPPKDDFVLDTTKIHKVNGVLKLPLDNGKEVVFRDTYDTNDYADFGYTYKGFNKKANCYLVLGLHKIDFIKYLLVYKTNGNIDTCRMNPVYSPKVKNYGYFIIEEYPEGGNIIFKNLKTQKTVKIKINKEFPVDFRWIDNKKFVFYTCHWNDPHKHIKLREYYLVQIKQ